MRTYGIRGSCTTFARPPRHLYRNDQAERITQWMSGTVPWDAPDPM